MNQANRQHPRPHNSRVCANNCNVLAAEDVLKITRRAGYKGFPIKKFLLLLRDSDIG